LALLVVEGIMVGLYIFGGVIVLGLAALAYFKIKWAREGARKWAPVPETVNPPKK